MGLSLCLLFFIFVQLRQFALARRLQREPTQIQLSPETPGVQGARICRDEVPWAGTLSLVQVLSLVRLKSSATLWHFPAPLDAHFWHLSARRDDLCLASAARILPSAF